MTCARIAVVPAFLAISLALVCVAAGLAAAPPVTLRPAVLRVEYLVNPLAVQEQTPALRLGVC